MRLFNGIAKLTPFSSGRTQVICFTVLVLLFGCTKTEPNVTAPPSSPRNLAQIPSDSRASGAIASPPQHPAAPVTTIGTTEPIRLPASASRATGSVTLNFVDASVREITRTILGKILKVTYTIDSNVRGTGTVQTAGPVSQQRALQILEGLLEQNGASISVENGVYRVSSTQVAALSANLAGKSGIGTGTSIVQLRYTSAKDLATLLAPFIPTGAKVTPDPTRNVLLITGNATTRNTLDEVVRAFDIDLLANKSFALFPVNSDDPDRVAAQLSAVLKSSGSNALAGVVQVIPMDRINAVLVVSTQPRYLDDVRRLFSLVNKVRETTARTWHIYYARNGRSSELAHILQEAFTPDDVTATGGGNSAHLGSTVPGLQISSQISGTGSGVGGTMGSSGMSVATGVGGGLTSTNSGGSAATTSPVASSNSTAAVVAAQREGPMSSAAIQALSESERSGAKDQIRIIADKFNNALVIYATQQEYEMIQGMLEKIDILPLQVEIDAVIAEVNLNDQLQYGVQFYFQHGGLSGVLSQNSQSDTGLPFSVNFPGFVLAKASGAVQYTISALQAVTKVRVLSSPQITVLDNETATLQVGDQVPYLTQTASILQGATTAGTPIVNSIAYQETGVILQVAPRVNAGGLVTLDIAQEVSEPIATTTSGINSPTFSNRLIKSKVVVQDGQTIGLAGMISDNVSRINGGVPLLKDIPVLGTVFSNQDNQRTRTELLVLLTPHVDYDQRAARALTQDLRSRLWHAGLVPSQLQNLPQSGSADPNGLIFRKPSAWPCEVEGRAGSRC
jgi:general secretion pathway protein D